MNEMVNSTLSYNFSTIPKNILMPMVAKCKNNRKCFYKSVINDGCDILVTIYELHYTILPNSSAF